MPFTGNTSRRYLTRVATLLPVSHGDGVLARLLKCLSGMGVSALEKEEVDSENIPQELLSNLSHPQSSPRKWLKSKVNYKDVVIVCRPKLN